MSEEKQTNHILLVHLLSESPITKDSAIFTFRKSIDPDVLENADLMIVSFASTDFDNQMQSGKKSTQTGSKIRDIAERSPGALGDFYTFIKKYKWWQIYIGFAGSVLMATLVWKWIIRLITGQPFF